MEPRKISEQAAPASALERPELVTPTAEKTYAADILQSIDEADGKLDDVEAVAVVAEELHSNFDTPSTAGSVETSRLAEDLAPEEHDDQIRQLKEIAETKGLTTVFKVLDKLKQPHLKDDWHRYLAAHLRQHKNVFSVKERGPLWKELRMQLFSLSLPRSSQEEAKVSFAELVKSMEQFYAGIASLATVEKTQSLPYMSIELAQEADSAEPVFYIAVSLEHAELLSNHILAIFPEATITAEADDYNIFTEGNVTVGAHAVLSKNSVYPLTTYEDLSEDPITAFLTAFSKIEELGEGAAIQFVIDPTVATLYQKKYEYAIKQLEDGISAREALNITDTIVGDATKAVGGLAKDLFKSATGNKAGEKKVDQTAVEEVKKKIAAPCYHANIRIVASAKNNNEAHQALQQLSSVFHQVSRTTGNSVSFKEVKGGALKTLIENFIYRRKEPRQAIVLNTRELSTVMHFHTDRLGGAADLKRSKFATAPAPAKLPKEGVLLGYNESRGTRREVRLAPEDRLRHLYTIGQTGTGKSTFLKNLVIQDIQNGDGVCFIDPHGSDVQDVLAAVPESRWDDVIYFDPSFTDRPYGLNMLEYDQNYPEQKTFVVNELFGIFQKLYGANPESMGPMFEQYFRNATMLVIEDPGSGSTLLDVSRVLADQTFRDLKLSRCQNPVVKQFWTEVAGKAGGEAQLANIVPYITSKFDVFLANDIMRPIVAQQTSAFNFRKLMDERKILLVNLSKGRLGDINANLLGLILVGKILMAALSRVDNLSGELAPFYLYIDEFQNVTTNSISTILSEARKYKLSLTVAHQFIAQLDEKIKESVFGNVGSMVSFRIGNEDAEVMESRFAPQFDRLDLASIENRNAYVKPLINGYPAPAFNISVPQPIVGNVENSTAIKSLSHIKYGRSKVEVEAEINNRY